MIRVVSLMLLVLMGCTKPMGDGYMRYSTNTHYTRHPYILELDDKVEAQFIVNDSWYYTTEHNGWSKIIGYSDDLVNHNNSVQIVFKCVDNRLYLGYYCYVNEVSPQYNTEQKGVICECYPGNKYHVITERRGGYYYIEIKGNGDVYSKSVEAGGNKMGHILFPYIGGSYTIKGFYIDLKLY